MCCTCDEGAHAQFHNPRTILFGDTEKTQLIVATTYLQLPTTPMGIAHTAVGPTIVLSVFSKRSSTLPHISAAY